MKHRAEISPVLVRTLRVFGRRRRRLVLARGLGATAAAAVALTALGAAVDYYFVLPNVLRVALSAAVYAIVILILYLSCLRFVGWRTGLRELARSYENYRPELREEILSAVELALDDPAARADSPALRARLQEDASAQILNQNVIELLPGRLARRWVATGTGAAALCAVLCLAPGLQYARLLARVLAPLAPIERVSRTRLRLIAPARAGALVPRGDPLRVVVETRGRRPPDAFIEFTESGEKWTHLLMDREGERRFSATLTLAGEALRFRVRAGDGATPVIQIRTAPRPAVSAFVKTYHFPKYSRLPERTIAEADGDLAAIEGTSVTLALAVDQPITRGTLEIAAQDGAATMTLPMRAAAPTTTTLTGVVSLKKNGTYRVRLIAARTGFENTFSPQYEIRVQPDAPPTIAIAEPTGALGLGAAGQVLFSGEARADVALGRVSERLSVNGGPWRETELYRAADRSGTDYSILKRVRMAPLNLQAGDRVLVKYAASDGKGQAAESAVTTITIGAGGSAADRLRAATERRMLQAALERVRAAGKALGEQAKPMQNAYGKLPERQAELEKALALREQTARAADEAWRALRESLRGAGSPRETEDLVALGRQLSQLRKDSLDRAKAALEAPARNPRDAKKNEVDAAANAMKNAGWLAERIGRTHAELFAADQAEGVAEELGRLAREQSRTARQAAEARDAAGWNEAARRQENLNAELAAAEEAMARMAGDLDEWQGRDARNQAEKLKTEREAAAKALTEKGPGAALAEDVKRMEQALAEVAGKMETMKGTLAERAERDREELARSLPRSADAIAGIARDPRHPANGASWQGAIRALEDRATLEEARADADYQFAADTSRAAEAVRALADETRHAIPGRAAQEKLAGVERAYRTLETARDMDETAGRLNAMAQRERLGAPATGRPRTAGQWRLAEEELNGQRNQVGRIGLPKEVVKEMEQVARGPAPDAIKREIRDRERDRSGARPPQTMAGNLDTVRTGLESVAAKIKERIPRERQALIAAAPTIEQLAAQAAREAATLKRENAGKADAAKPDPGPTGARESLQKQRDTTPPLDRLRNALRRDANAQDLAAEPGRERARDADDALAMLREPPPRAEAELERAAEATQPAPRKEALGQAARQQDKLARSLDAIALHYRNLEAGRPEPSRELLRQAEAEMKKELDAQYAEAARLARMEAATPEALRQALEAEVPRNPAMQNELGAIQQDELARAEGRLDAAARKEGEIARQVDDLVKSPPRRPPSFKPQTQAQQTIDEDVVAAADELERAALHALRLNRPDGVALDRAGEATRAIANKELPQARAGLETADREKKAAPAQAPVAAARDALGRQAEKLAAAQSPPPPPAPAPPSAAARWMAQTLDKLDAAAQGAKTAQSSKNSLASPAQGAQQLLAQARAERQASPAGDALSMTSGPPPADGNGQPLPALAELQGGEWGKLRELSASDPAQAGQEAIAEDYRGMVSAYYKALARRAK